MNILNENFPGNYRKSDKGYNYYFIGDVFNSSKIELNNKIYQELEKTTLQLGRFSALIEKIPNPLLYISAFNNKEATLSSRIEGTQTNIGDTFKDEQYVNPEKKDDWVEVKSYIEALEHAKEGLKELPLCSRLIKSTHKILLSHSRGKNKQPGEFRKSQNWIGGTNPQNAHFVPPTQEYVNEAMGNLEKFIQDDKIPLPSLIKSAFIHYQFETIHPFLDGNGRIGRMLISLFLLEQKILKEPILYISEFFENNRENYYYYLDKARENKQGIKNWIRFFLKGICVTATKGIEITEAILKLEEDIEKNRIPQMGRMTNNAQKLLKLLFYYPVVGSKDIAQKLEINSQPTQNLIAKFVELKILFEITGHKRNRVFVFKEYLTLLEKG